MAAEAPDTGSPLGAALPVSLPTTEDDTTCLARASQRSPRWGHRELAQVLPAVAGSHSKP